MHKIINDELINILIKKHEKLFNKASYSFSTIRKSEKDTLRLPEFEIRMYCGAFDKRLVNITLPLTTSTLRGLMYLVKQKEIKKQSEDNLKKELLLNILKYSNGIFPFEIKEEEVNMYIEKSENNYTDSDLAVIKFLIDLEKFIWFIYNKYIANEIFDKDYLELIQDKTIRKELDILKRIGE